MVRVSFWFEVCCQGVQSGFLSERKVIPCRGAEDRKGAGTSSGKSGARNLEAESNYFYQKQSGD